MMEWSVPVNDMLNDEITKMNYTLLPPGYHGDVRAMRGMQECLSNLIDTLGEHSSAAQGLNRIITTADKLRNAPTHILYLLKDANAKNGHGEVIGFLKVAHKNLYLFDERDQAREVEPLCVLDFYIVEERQRSGYGRVLFDYMLHDMEVKPHQLAIDGPSPKMEKFMAKNYGITRLIRHSNNFAVAPEFFDNTESINNKSGRSTPTVAHAPVGRFAAHKPHSDIGNVIHGGASYYSETNNGLARRSHLYNSRHTSNIWSTFRSGDSSEREFERFAESPAPLNDGDRLPEPLPWAPPAPADDRQHCWDSYFDGDEAQRKECSERPQSLRVEPPAAPAPFADLPAAGLPTGTGTPSCGIGGGIKRDNNQLTDKGYFDVKNYHNRLW